MIFFLQLNHIFSSNYFRSLKTILMLKIKKKNDVSVRVSSNCNPHTLLSEVQNGTATLENSRFFSLRYIYFVLSPFSHVQFFVTLWNVDCHAPLSMGFSKQEYWSELPCSASGDLPDPGIKLWSLKSPALAGRFITTSAWEAPK